MISIVLGRGHPFGYNPLSGDTARIIALNCFPLDGM